MNYLLTFLSISLFSFLFKGADIPGSQVPAKVSTTFYENFTSAEDIEWSKIKHGAFEVAFKILDIDYKAQISKSGNLIKYKHDVKLSTIPGDLATVLATDYSDYQIGTIEKVVIGSTAYYQVELENSSAEKNNVFTPTGKEAKKLDYWD